MLTMYTIYKSPADYPGLYVCRRWVIERGGKTTADDDVLIAHADLEVVRAAMPPDLYHLRRDEDDEPQILETWI